MSELKNYRILSRCGGASGCLLAFGDFYLRRDYFPLVLVLELFRSDIVACRVGVFMVGGGVCAGLGVDKL